MTIQHRAILDRIQAVKDKFGSSPLVYERERLDREEVLGLEFKKGDHVRDKRTGKRGRVLAGYKRSLPKVPPA